MNAEELDQSLCDDELREFLGVSQAALDAYEPSEKLVRLYRGWSYITLQGIDHPGVFKTRRDALHDAIKHKAYKQAQQDNPSAYTSIQQVRAQKWLAAVEKYEADGATELDAVRRANIEFPRQGVWAA